MKIDLGTSHYDGQNIENNPLQHDLNGVLRDTDVKIGFYQALMEGYSGGDPNTEFPYLEKISSDFLKAIIPNYERVKRAVVRKTSVYDKLSVHEKEIYYQLLCELEYYCSCVLHLKRVSETPHPFCLLRLPLSRWSRKGIQSISFNPCTLRLKMKIRKFQLQTHCFVKTERAKDELRNKSPDRASN